MPGFSVTQSGPRKGSMNRGDPEKIRAVLEKFTLPTAKTEAKLTLQASSINVHCSHFFTNYKRMPAIGQKYLNQA